MLLLTLWVNVNVKFAWPSAGREMPSIFCSTHGPRSVLVVTVLTTGVPDHGHSNRICGRLRPRDDASSPITSQAMAFLKISPMTAAATTHAQRGTLRRRARGPRTQDDNACVNTLTSGRRTGRGCTAP